MTNKNNKKAQEEFDRQTKHYFESIKIKPVLHLPIFETKVVSPDECEIFLPLPCCAILWIYEEYNLFKWIDIAFAKNVSDKCHDKEQKCETTNGTPFSDQPRVSYNCRCDLLTKILQSDLYVNDGDIRFKMFQFSSHMPLVFIPEKQLLISGLSAILRFLIKFVFMKMDHQLQFNKEDEKTANSDSASLQILLGFRGGCLQACAEVSVWTKFCEVDIFDGVQRALHHEPFESIGNSKKELSRELFRFEYHLRKPVKIHNIRREQKLAAMEKGNNSSTELEHEFAEGPRMLLSDLIIYPCITLFQSLYGPEIFEKHFPKTSKWYSKMNNRFQLSWKLKLCEPMPLVERSSETTITSSWEVPQVPEESLYKSDRSRYNPNSRVYTKQTEIEDALESFRSRNIAISEVVDVGEFLNWDDVPPLAHPNEGGKLPLSRRDRKCIQLSALTIEVMKVVAEKVKQNNYSSATTPLRIVDFCSGGGHLGILLAYLLPQCQIILVENKEESLRRAWDRVEQMQLTNVLLYQQNLSYFDLDFQVGVALHACGQATDLVLKNCLRANASLCVSPCCYGSIQSNHMLHYPRSRAFQESGISLRHYFILAHASDQTHDEKHEKTAQGKQCMQIVDSDRCHQISENGYEVSLKKFEETASPKCHILIAKKIQE